MNFSLIWPFLLVACIIFIHVWHSISRTRKRIQSINELLTQVEKKTSDLSVENAFLKDRLKQLESCDEQDFVSEDIFCDDISK